MDERRRAVQLRATFQLYKSAAVVSRTKKALRLQQTNTAGGRKKKQLLHRPKTVKCTVKRVTAGHLERSIDPVNTFRMIDAPSQYAGSFFQNRRLESLPARR